MGNGPISETSARLERFMALIEPCLGGWGSAWRGVADQSIRRDFKVRYCELSGRWRAIPVDALGGLLNNDSVTLALGRGVDGNRTFIRKIGNIFC